MIGPEISTIFSVLRIFSLAFTLTTRKPDQF
jgi:hypothetical protein